MGLWPAVAGMQQLEELCVQVCTSYEEPTIIGAGAWQALADCKQLNTLRLEGNFILVEDVEDKGGSVGGSVGGSWSLLKG